MSSLLANGNSANAAEIWGIRLAQVVLWELKVSSESRLEIFKNKTVSDELMMLLIVVYYCLVYSENLVLRAIRDISQLFYSFTYFGTGKIDFF